MFGLAQHAMPASSTPLALWFTVSSGAAHLMDDRSNIIPSLSGNFLMGGCFSSGPASLLDTHLYARFNHVIRGRHSTLVETPLPAESESLHERRQVNQLVLRRRSAG